MPRDRPSLSDRVTNAAARGVIGLALALPYRWRVPLMGWVAARIAAPLAGWDKRVRANLAHVMPDLPEAEVRRMVRRVPDNIGRALIETYSGDTFRARLRDAPLNGPGVAALEAAHRGGRPVLFITGHFGNYEAARAALTMRGYTVGGLYNPMENPLFNAHYTRAMAALGEPIFPRSRKGMARMVRHVRGGGMVGLIVDQFIRHGTPLDFLGKPALTALSAAEMAVKYDALAIPIYGIRRPDGLDFDVLVEEPIPHGAPEEMTQAMNDSLAAQVRKHPEQWFWIHRRWKTKPGAWHPDEP